MGRSLVVGCLLAALASSAAGFAIVPPSTARTTALFSSEDGVEQIEFKIFPDGRIEETVRGIKGNNCHQVTDKINESLGEVVASRPTEEMYEQEIVIDQTITQTNNNGDSSSSSSSWSGDSTW